MQTFKILKGRHQHFNLYPFIKTLQWEYSDALENLYIIRTANDNKYFQVWLCFWRFEVKCGEGLERNL